MDRDNYVLVTWRQSSCWFATSGANPQRVKGDQDIIEHRAACALKKSGLVEIIGPSWFAQKIDKEKV